MYYKYLLRTAGIALSALVLLAFAMPGDGFAAPKAKNKPPLQLETYKSFYFGGERVNRPNGTVGLSGHGYAEAFIPHGKKKPPIVLLHSSIPGAIFLQRLNGEEGWAMLMARAGYPVYVIDPPGTGRASVDLTLYDKSLVTQNDSSSWAGWKHGPAFAQQGFNPPNAPFDATPHQFPMNQSPTDEESVNQFLGSQMIYRVSQGAAIRNAALIALIEEYIGEPVIWMGWSDGGAIAQDLVPLRPDLFKAVAHIEGCRMGPTLLSFIDTVAAHKIPFLHVNPDYARVGSQSYLPSGSRCVSPDAVEPQIDVAAEIRARGGNALTVYLPDVGIYGNGHEFMLQDNADEIAERVYLPWLKENVK